MRYEVDPSFTVGAMDLFEFEEKRHVGREEAAAWLRVLADELARHNEVELARDGRRVTVRVPDEVDLKVELEMGTEETELEIELSW